MEIRWTTTGRRSGRPREPRLWDLVSTAFPLYETYRKRTARVIPLFVLEPLETTTLD